MLYLMEDSPMSSVRSPAWYSRFIVYRFHSWISAFIFIYVSDVYVVDVLSKMF
jgi:hypothetical protein